MTLLHLVSEDQGDSDRLVRSDETMAAYAFFLLFFFLLLILDYGETSRGTRH